MKDVVLLSHYDLDGAGCSVLADHIWNVVDRKHQGYPKVRQSLGYLIGKHYMNVDTIVIADLKMELEDLRLAMFAFPNVIYYDHHESSADFEHLINDSHSNGTFEFHFDLLKTSLNKRVSILPNNRPGSAIPACSCRRRLGPPY